MRRQGQYADSGVNAYVTAQMQHMSGQRMEHKSSHFQGRLEGLNSEKEHLYGTSKVEGQWRWERDGPKVQGGDALSFYQGQRPDAKLGLEKQSNNDPRSQPHEEDMDIGYEDNPLSHTFEGIEKKFHDDLLKLAKEQTDAEDVENARHREDSNIYDLDGNRSN
uniref:Uncharacterized protein n=1 Tax=Vitis vinifera TaxID=29760 RepID=A5BQQ7_VITVI|nr:hypothetical protein VITISV_040428 [Vitis vinifera]